MSAALTAARAERRELGRRAFATFRQSGFREAHFPLPEDQLARRDAYIAINARAYAVFGPGGYTIAVRDGGVTVDATGAEPIRTRKLRTRSPGVPGHEASPRAGGTALFVAVPGVSSLNSAAPAEMRARRLFREERAS